MGETNEYDELGRLIGYTFNDPSLPKMAFSHSSAVEKSGSDPPADNERLEFLGDAVLGFQITRMLFSSFPRKSEGDLTKYRAMVVCQSTLAGKARSLNLGRFLLLGPGEDKTGGRDKDSLLAGAFEALIGAVYLDGGVAASTALAELLFREEIDAIGEGVYPFFDYKSTLQEYCHQEGLGEPSYSTVSVNGPPHNRIFEVSIFIQRQDTATGTGKTKKTAQREAAKAALRVLGFPT